MTSRSEAAAGGQGVKSENPSLDRTSLDRTIAEVTRVLLERLELQLDPAEIHADSEFFDDIGLDSAAVLDLVIGLEESFGIDFDIAGSDPEDFRSVRCLARYVESRR